MVVLVMVMSTAAATVDDMVMQGWEWMRFDDQVMTSPVVSRFVTVLRQ